MRDFPLAVMTAAIWTYWLIVGAMIVRLRRRRRKLVGVVPEQRVERLMWLAWVPLVVAWCALPWLALAHARAPFGLPEFARTVPAYVVLRHLAMVVALASFACTIASWRKMGKDWRMDVAVGERTNLITDGMFARIRHPIYAFSIVFLVCTVVVVPTWPMAAVALGQIVLWVLKARNEERHLLATHGDAYASYLRRTGRFVPRFRGLSH